MKKKSAGTDRSHKFNFQRMVEKDKKKKIDKKNFFLFVVQRQEANFFHPTPGPSHLPERPEARRAILVKKMWP